MIESEIEITEEDDGNNETRSSGSRDADDTSSVGDVNDASSTTGSSEEEYESQALLSMTDQQLAASRTDAVSDEDAPGRERRLWGPALVGFVLAFCCILLLGLAWRFQSFSTPIFDDNKKYNNNSLVYCIRNSTLPACCTKHQCGLIQNSTLLSTCCGNVPNSSLKNISRVYPLLLTSTPRSGTVFMTDLLTALDIPMADDGHMPNNTFGMVSWIHIFKDTTYNLWWTGARHLYDSKFRVVWHQVRDPLKTLTSMAFTEPLGDIRYLAYLKRHIVLSDKHSTAFCKTCVEGYERIRIQRALEFYLQWHEFIVSLKVPLFRLEELSTALNDIFESIDRPPPDPAKVKQFVNNRLRRRRLLNHNHRQHRPTLQWRELCNVNVDLTRAFLQMSQSFGYYRNQTARVC